ncbi:MAG: hypothetical protein JXB17_00335 [Bacteroidales bacterium]|nr:hypothetical protein [Bacteroidales bacterium]
MYNALKKIRNYFNPDQEYILMFSGGVDSSCILGAAIDANININPVWINNGLNRATEKEIIQQANNLGAKNLKIINIETNKEICANPVNRCYLCKKSILNSINKPNKIIVDGTTKSDLGNYRPGSKALDEYSVKSILAECGIDKKTATDIAIHFGASANLAGMESCLATRFNYNLQITREKIDVIRNIERFIIQQTGDYNVRCRIDDEDHMRIELTNEDAFAKLVLKDFSEKIINLSKGITMFVTLDLKPSRPNEYDKRIKK